MNRAEKKRWLPWALGALVLILVAVPLAAWVVLNSSAVQERVKNEVQARASERLGREVSIGEVDAELFPSIAIVLRDFRIAGAEGEPSLVDAEAARVNVALWPLLRSLGDDVRMDAFTLQSPTLTLVKVGEETWSYEEITENLERTAPPEEGGSERDVFVERAEIEAGTLRIIDRTTKPEAVVVLQGIDIEAEDIAFGEPLEVEGSASIGGREENLEGTLKLDRLPRSWDRPEDWPQVTATVRGEDLPLQAFGAMLPAKLGAAVGGGAIDLRTDVKTANDRSLAVTGRVDVSSLRLRTGEGRAGFNFSTRITPGGTDRLQVALEDLQVKGPGVELGGKATVATDPLMMRFAIAGPLLNLDTVMDALPQTPKPQMAEGTGGSAEPMVSDELREKLASADVEGTLRIDQVQSGKLTAQNLDAAARLEEGTLALQKGSASVYGGTVDLAGTTVAMAEAIPTWRLSATLSKLQLGTAMSALTGQQPVEGDVGGTLTLEGEGNDWQAIREAVTGAGKMTLRDGALAANLRGALAGAVTQALEKIGRKDFAARAQQAGKSGLESLQSSFRIDDGWLALAAPLEVETPYGAFTLGGRVGLNQALELDGSVALPPSFVAQITGGKWKPSGEVVLPIGVTGTLTSPVVSPTEPAALVKQLVGGEARRRGEEVKEKVEDRVKDEVKKRTEGLFDRF